jgi:hypothetical protein
MTQLRDSILVALTHKCNCLKSGASTTIEFKEMSFPPRVSETNRPGFISTVRSDLPQPTHRFEEEDTIGVILFLRLKASHLHPKYRVFNGNHYALL